MILYPFPDRPSLPTRQLRKKIQNFSFLLTDQIGKGYSSTVYKALNDTTGQQVAIKVIQLHSLRDQISKGMLQTQLACFRDTNHNNLLKSISSFFTVNNCYIVTELCSAGDLSKRIRQRGRFTQQQAKSLFFQIYNGYQSLYNSGYIHRDIKPANIFITSSGQLKIADFGFSKKRNNIERESYNVGTPIYMPRQSLSSNIYNQKTQVWSLGVTLYQMVYGHVPFRGRTQAQLKVLIQRGYVNYPQQVMISSQLRNFIGRCLNSDPNQRMGVVQMGRHPWLASYVEGKQHKRRNSLHPNTNTTLTYKNEQTITITKPSFEQDGDNNRQQFYLYDKQNKYNRRSAASIQKLKLCQNKKSGIFQRKPLANKLNTYLTQQKDFKLMIRNPSNFKQKQDRYNNKENHQINRVNTASMQNLKKTSTNKPITKQPKSSKIDTQKMVTLIGYFRFLYKFYQKVTMAKKQIFVSQFKLQLQTMQSVLRRQTSGVVRMHVQSCRNKNNVFGLDEDMWIDFVRSQRWEMYQFVISRYQTKYAQMMEGDTAPSNIKFDWKQLFSTFFSKFQTIQQKNILISKQKHVLLQLLCFIHHLLNLNQIKEQGWQTFSQNFSDPKQIILQDYELNERIYNHNNAKIKSYWKMINE